MYNIYSYFSSSSITQTHMVILKRSTHTHKKKMLLHESALQLITTDVTYLLFSQKIRDDACSSVSRYLRLELHCDLQDGAKPIHPSATQRQRTGNTPEKTHARTRVSSSSSASCQTDPPPSDTKATYR